MKNKQVLETLVSPKDLLKEDLKIVKGGNGTAGVECGNGKLTLKCKSGKITTFMPLSVW